MKILLPVDGSDYTKRMLSYVAAHDELLGSGHEYTIFTVVPPIPAHVTRFLDRAAVDGYCDELAEQVLAPVRAFANSSAGRFRSRTRPATPPKRSPRGRRPTSPI